jgi:hypothetical protein
MRWTFTAHHFKEHLIVSYALSGSQVIFFTHSRQDPRASGVMPELSFGAIRFIDSGVRNL